MNVGVAVEALTLSLGAFRLQKLDFAVTRGEIVVLLGPNGSGKSVTLETIAGFHRPETGRVLIGGRDVTALPPEQRKVGFVVQNFGLFPHLSVAQNVAIARRGGPILLPGGESAPAHGDAAALLDYFGIAQLAQRAPQDLSPGEKQRVALARALAGAPDLFLFDEPFAALDAQTREQLREELLSFLRKLSIPAVFVTHDRSDAMVLADRIVVLRDGAAMQSGAAAEVFQKPENSFVARFVGFENLVPASLNELSEGIATLAVGECVLRAAAPAHRGAIPSSVMLAVRAEDVTLTVPQSGAATARHTNRLIGRVIGLCHAGPLVTVSIDCGFRLKAYLLAPQLRDLKLEVGDPIAAAIAPESIHLMGQ